MPVCGVWGPEIEKLGAEGIDWFVYNALEDFLKVVTGFELAFPPAGLARIICDFEDHSIGANGLSAELRTGAPLLEEWDADAPCEGRAYGVCFGHVLSCLNIVELIIR